VNRGTIIHRELRTVPARQRDYWDARLKLALRRDGSRRPKGWYELTSSVGTSAVFHLPDDDHQAAEWCVAVRRHARRAGEDQAILVERVPRSEVDRRVIFRHLSDEEYEALKQRREQGPHLRTLRYEDWDGLRVGIVGWVDNDGNEVDRDGVRVGD
jgi:hypothetical protein